ncbi:hypothetical protein I552_10242 [Mycobacterium xenopi 3993]|nr:hypothetical protein I552_10226 [Mycobacterium xenopi 3993]EUA33022.1 hypothetical protein I552_10242 [Mycobacterium xenopi 3993]
MMNDWISNPYSIAAQIGDLFETRGRKSSASSWPSSAA